MREKHYGPKQAEQALGDGGKALSLMEFIATPGLALPVAEVGDSLVGPAGLFQSLLVDSLKRGGREIHIEPYEKEFRVRCRIDGILYNFMALPMGLKDPLTGWVCGS